MNGHPYWSYVAVPDSLNAEQETAAVDEGRRAAALELACTWDDTDAGILARAKKFEEYLKTGVVTDENGAKIE